MGNTVTLLNGGGTDGVSAANGVRSSPTWHLELPLRPADHPPCFRFRTLVDLSQTLPPEPDFPQPVLPRRTHSHALTTERLANLPFLAVEREPARALHF